MGFHKSIFNRYPAIKVVSLHDARLAFVFWGSIFASFALTFIYIIVAKRYQESCEATTLQHIKVKGEALFSCEEDMFHKTMQYSEIVHWYDNANVFITTSFYDEFNVEGRPDERVRATATRTMAPDHMTNFTVYWMQEVTFGKFDNKKRDNRAESGVPLMDHFNLYEVDFVLREASQVSGMPFDMNEIIRMGAIVQINCNWKCDFDAWADWCNHECRYFRLDDGMPVSYRESHIMPDGTRRIRKSKGIQLIFQLDGTAWQFSGNTMLLGCITAFGYMALIRTLANLFAVFVVGHGHRYLNEIQDHLYYDEAREKWIVTKLKYPGNDLAPSLFDIFPVY